MRKILCVLCAMVMALLPVVGMAQNGNLQWVEFEGMAKDAALQQSPSALFYAEGGALLYLLSIYDVRTARNEVEDTVFYGKDVYCGAKGDMAYIVAGYDETHSVVIEFDTAKVTFRYLLVEVDDHAVNGSICQVFCDDTNLQIDPEAIGELLKQIFG
ncbi:MAG: hypothetical protein E7331_12170 [Clostridiales bacterium]|nr:hypothetical protein [Clostridiales bacterium]